MEYKDYYAILGVERDATEDEIKRSYRTLARKYHPDVSKLPHAEEKFKEIGEAYEVLRDPEKRAAYDRLGSGYTGGQEFQPPPDWDVGFEFRGGGFTEADAAQFSDFFEAIFGGRGFGAHPAGAHLGSAHPAGARRGGGRARGEDHHARILLDLEDAFAGATRSLTLQSPQLTEDGRVVARERTLNVKIPRGIRQGQEIRLAGQGGPGVGGHGAGGPGAGGAEAGDLYLEVAFRPHRFYRAAGADLYLDLPVAPWEAALGAKVKVPTPTGAVRITIPKDSQGGTQLRLKGQGIPSHTPGDLYVTLRITLPPADSEKAKRLYEQMAEDLAFNPRAELGVSPS